MRLAKLVDKFATTEFMDAADNSVRFFAHVRPFNDVANTSTTARWRIFEVLPGTYMGSSGVVRSVQEGHSYIVGLRNVDFWRNTEIRHKYPAAPVDFGGVIGSPAVMLDDTQAGASVSIALYFVARDAVKEEKADYFNRVEVFMPAASDPAKAGDILLADEVYYRFITDMLSEGAGFNYAQAVAVPDPIQYFDIIHADTYDPVGESTTAQTYLNVKCFVMSLYKTYDWVSPAHPEVLPGDVSISVLKSDAAISVGDKIGDYSVVSVADRGVYYEAHCRV